MPLDIYYSRTSTRDNDIKAWSSRRRAEAATPRKAGIRWRRTSQQGAAQLRQTPDGSRMYGIWLEESEQGSDSCSQNALPRCLGLRREEEK